MSDPDRAIARAYEAVRRVIGLNRRVTYVIDPEGRIAAAFKNELDPGSHDREVRAFFRERADTSPAR